MAQKTMTFADNSTFTETKLFLTETLGTPVVSWNKITDASDELNYFAQEAYPFQSYEHGEVLYAVVEWGCDMWGIDLYKTAEEAAEAFTSFAYASEWYQEADGTRTERDEEIVAQLDLISERAAALFLADPTKEQSFSTDEVDPEGSSWGGGTKVVITRVIVDRNA